MQKNGSLTVNVVEILSCCVTAVGSRTGWSSNQPLLNKQLLPFAFVLLFVCIALCCSLMLFIFVLITIFQM